MPPKSLRIQLRDGHTAVGLEWPAPQAAMTCLLIAQAHGPADWAECARRLDGKLRLIALPAVMSAKLIAKLLPAGEKLLMVAHGDAGPAALRIAAASPRAIAGLVLADYAPGPDMAPPGGLPCPLLFLRGRQSKAVSHEAVVRAREGFPGSWLIEPEDCGAWPFGGCPEAAASAILWFASAADARQTEAEYHEGGIEEPVDPRPRA